MPTCTGCGSPNGKNTNWNDCLCYNCEAAKNRIKSKGSYAGVG